MKGRAHPLRTRRALLDLARGNSFPAERQFLEQVNPVIACDDTMFGGSAHSYFAAGLDVVRVIDRALADSQTADVRTVLDLPSGWGRALRFASDIVYASPEVLRAALRGQTEPIGSLAARGGGVLASAERAVP